MLYGDKLYERRTGEEGDFTQVSSLSSTREDKFRMLDFFSGTGIVEK